MCETGGTAALEAVDRRHRVRVRKARAKEPFAALLLRWFERYGRDLPWRRDRDPYRVVVAEFMLAQTQVERVGPLFEAFVGRFPSFAALAAASQADVVRTWRGLGYNLRAVRLHRLAKAVVAAHEGLLPHDEAALLALPGIGPYTARAVRAFAFDADELAVDTNVRRVIGRTQFGVEWPHRAGERQLDAAGRALLPRRKGYAFNSALMDLGATLCTARAPKCMLCPLRAICAAAPLDATRLERPAARHAPQRGPQARLRFEATTRYVRGRVVERLRALPPGERISLLDLHAELAPRLVHHDAAAFAKIVSRLEGDGMLEISDGAVRLAD